jgi:hypothetical protein
MRSNGLFEKQIQEDAIGSVSFFIVSIVPPGSGPGWNSRKNDILTAFQ